MFKKHHLSILIVVFSLLGIVSQKQTDVPNQEIVIQFINSNVGVEEAEDIISSIKNQLKELGVDDVNVSEENSGELKITYHSNSDISSIKDKLSKVRKLKIDLSGKSNPASEKPSQEDSITYNLDVHEIRKNNSTDWGFNGINAYSLDSKSDRLYNPSLNLFFTVFSFENDNNIASETYKVKKNIALAINNIPHKIPEGRAGPIC